MDRIRVVIAEDEAMTDGVVLPGWICGACGVFNGSAKEVLLACRACDAPRGPELDEAPYVCPGCYAVAPEHCLPGCIDAEIEAEAEWEREHGEPNYHDVPDDDPELGEG